MRYPKSALVLPDEARRDYGIALGNQQLLKLSRRGDLPPFVKISERKWAFVRAELDAHFANLITERDRKQAA
jgi:hypothetical protein